jgi:hypothetical protein
MGRNAWLLLGCAVLGGCEQLEGILDVQAPKAALNRLDLVKNPTVNQMAGWGCEEILGELFCENTLGLNTPNKNQMQFSFDIVFDLTNPNDNLPIPLVETLLGFTAFDAANLGSICVSFCDPEVEDCDPTVNAVGACDPKGANDVDSPADLIPTVEDLLELGEAVAEGELDNGDWRVIKGGQTLESHIQFDLGIDPFLDIADELIEQAVDDAVDGRKIVLDIPFTAEGTLFFDVPELGREAIGFGPFDDVWTLK